MLEPGLIAGAPPATWQECAQKRHTAVVSWPIAAPLWGFGGLRAGARM